MKRKLLSVTRLLSEGESERFLLNSIATDSHNLLIRQLIMWPQSLCCFAFLSSLFSETHAAVIVETPLYGTVQLPCKFPFVTEFQDSIVTWVKVSDRDNDVAPQVVHSFQRGQDITEDQDPSYKGRTSISPEMSKGKMDLTLTDVTFDDEGSYYCQAANRLSREFKEIQLSITSLGAEDPSVTTDGENRLKCMSEGLYKDPQVQWQDRDGNDFSSYGKLNVTDLGDGRKKVESVLEYPYETNKQYFCHVKEGRLRRSARAVVSDGKEPVFIKDDP
ncbi:butyrophilin-like protein 2 isoform X1 [Xenopus laevis]|uniref:Butyrophilin-like protein 2 isoform X1 n=2 Tax=Xenopus laevis TaxID=8355 RepID=A0A8J1M8F3_XENLA|nr:butyrophilin-like protein 2 isoform X1 [Xenopus laevis]XP_041437315.1 butyrophilin-like protein 2 isoform X1 [Xenopus laevis]